jgi:transcriptional activator of cad operon
MIENTAADQATCWQLEKVTFSPARQQLQRGKQTVNLEPRQHSLLLVLLNAARQPVTRDQLIASVWQGRIVSESAINRAISVLRKAFYQLDPDTDYIQTRPKLGYQLAVTARPVQTPPMTHNAHLTINHNRRRYWYALMFLLASPVLAWWWLSRPQPVLQVGLATPHTSFDGTESRLNSNTAADTLLYQRVAQNGNNQIWLNNLIENSHTELTDSSEDSYGAALSPDGQQFAYVRYQATHCHIIVRPVLPSAMTLRTVHNCPLDNTPLLQWHPDGSHLYFRQRADKTRPYQLYRLSLASGSLQQLTLLPATYSGLGDVALAMSANTAQLALIRYISASRSQVIVIHPDTGEVLHSTDLAVRASNLSWISATQLLLSANQTLYQLDLATQTLLPVYHAADYINSVVFTPQMIYFSSTEVNTDIWRSSNDGPAQRIVDSSRIDSMPRISHDGQQLAFLSTRQGHYQIWLRQADGTERLLTELPGTPAFVRFEWSGDDNHLLLTQNGAAYTVHSRTGKLTELLSTDYQVNIANWGPDSNSIVFSSQRSGDWQLWQYDLSQHRLQQLTQNGGYSGRFWQEKLYYTKYHQDGIWYKNPGENDGQLLLANVDKINWLNWQIDNNKLYYYTPQLGIYQYDLQHATTKLHLAEVPQLVRHFSVQQDQVYYVTQRDMQGDIYRLPLLH